MAASFVGYIDEAGDEGFKSKCSEWFLLSGLITRKEWDIETVKLVHEVRKELGKSLLKPLHFRELSHVQKLLYVDRVSKSRVRAVTILIHKPSVAEPEKFDEKHRLYHYAVRLLLERLSWFCRDNRRSHGDGSIEIVFSNRGGMSYQDIKDYVDLLIDKSKVNVGGVKLFDIRIDPDIIKTSQMHTQSHGTSMGLQLADAIASGFFNGVEPRLGFVEDRYARMLKPVVYNRSRRFLGYGLKFFPTEVHALIAAGKPLEWAVKEYT